MIAASPTHRACMEFSRVLSVTHSCPFLMNCNLETALGLSHQLLKCEDDPRNHTNLHESVPFVKFRVISWIVLDCNPYLQAEFFRLKPVLRTHLIYFVILSCVPSSTRSNSTSSISVLINFKPQPRRPLPLPCSDTPPLCPDGA